VKTVYVLFMREDAIAITPTHEDSEPAAPAHDNEECDGRVVSLPRAQKLLGDLSYREVGLLCKRGELDSIKYGRRRMVATASIDRFLNKKFEEAGISVNDVRQMSCVERAEAANWMRQTRTVAA
jgi:hypothetical protein